MTEFANKYEQEAHALVQGLAGTKWDGGSSSTGTVQTKSVAGSLESFTLLAQTRLERSGPLLRVATNALS